MSLRKANCSYHCGPSTEISAKYNDFCSKVSIVLLATILPDRHNVGFKTCGTSGGYWRIQRDRRVGHNGNLQVATSRDVCSACFGFLNKALLLTKNHFRTTPVHHIPNTFSHSATNATTISTNSISESVPVLETQEEETQKDIDLPSTLPESFICPINGTLMRNPVMCADGHSYEKRAIETWFQRSNKSPLTNIVISNVLIPNHTLRKSIEEFIEIHKKNSSDKSSEKTS